MEKETFAEYFLEELDWNNKIDIMYYFKKRTGIYYDEKVIFKTLILKMFLDYCKTHNDINVDENIMISARLLCDCMKIENTTNLKDIQNYAKKGAEYLIEIGFDNEFSTIVEGVNRYTIQENRRIESDILEVVDQYGAMVLDRPERIGFEFDEALTLIRFRNLKDKDNKVLDEFEKFINYLDKFNSVKIINDRFRNIEVLTQAMSEAKEIYKEVKEKTVDFKLEPKNVMIEYRKSVKNVSVDTIKEDYKKQYREEANISPEETITLEDEENPYNKIDM